MKRLDERRLLQVLDALANAALAVVVTRSFDPTMMFSTPAVSIGENGIEAPPCRFVRSRDNHDMQSLKRPGYS